MPRETLYIRAGDRDAWAAFRAPDPTVGYVRASERDLWAEFQAERGRDPEVRSPSPARRKPPTSDHPLFPTEIGESTPAFEFITITRWDGGKQVWGPTFRADELTTPESISELFGGGSYVLKGRAASPQYEGSPGKVSVERRLTLPGRSRPLSTSGDEDVLSENGAPLATAPVPSSGDGMTQILMTMMAQQAQAAQAAQAAAQAQQQQFLAMMVQMMGGSKTESSTMVQTMLQLNQQSSAQMMQLMGVMMSNRGGGPEEFAKYADLMKALGLGSANGKPPEKEESISSVIENMADIVTGIAQLKGATQGGAAPAPGPGSAASVLEGMTRG